MINFQKIRTELHPLLVEAEQLRKKHLFFQKALWIMVASMILGFLFLPFITYYVNIAGFSKWIADTPGNGTRFSYFFYLFWVLYFVFLFKGNILGHKYKKIERELLKKILAQIAPEFVYNEQKQIKPEVITQSELIPKYTQVPGTKGQKTHNTGMGVLSGKVGETNVSLSDVKIINQSLFGSYFMLIPLFPHLYVVYNHLRPWFSKKHTRENINYNFSGMFAIIDFNKKLNGNTVILPDNFEKRIGYLAKTIQSLKLNRDELVNLENTDFENEFVIYSTDQVEARYILSTSFIELIMTLKRKVDSTIMLSFTNDKLYLAVQHPYGFLSFPKNKNLIDSNALELFCEKITTAIGIVEDLNLNTKIWKNESFTKSV